MGVVEGYNAVARSQESREQLRQSAAKQNAALTAAGFTPEGVATEQKQSTIDDTINMQAQELKRMKHKMWASDTASALDASISTGDWSHSNNLLADNPDLGKMWQNQGVYGISNINFDTDQKMLAQAGLNTENFDTDEKRQALHKSLFKVVDDKGNFSLRSAKDALIETRANKSMAANRLQTVQGILKSSRTALQPSQEDNLSKFTTSYKNLFPEATEDEVYEAFGRSLPKGKDGGLNQFQVDLAQYQAAIKGGFTGSMKNWQEMQKPGTAAKAEDRTQLKMAEQGELQFNDSIGNATIEQLDEPGVFKRAKVLQGDKKLGEVQAKDLNGKLGNLKGFSNVVDKLNKVDMDRNAMEKVRETVGKLTGTDFAAMSEQGKKELLNQFQFNSQLKAAVADYVKFMSGAAVTESERTMYNDIVSGGNWGTKEAMISSLSGFMDHLDTSYNNNLSGIRDTHQADYIRQKREYLRVKDMMGKIGIRELTDTDGKQVQPEKMATSAPTQPKTDLGQYNFGGN